MLWMIIKKLTLASFIFYLLIFSSISLACCSGGDILKSGTGGKKWGHQTWRYTPNIANIVIDPMEY